MYDNVTQQFSLPVLIPATAEQQEGVATFEQEAVIALTHALQNPSDTIALRKMLPLMRHIGFVGLSRALSRD